MKKLFSIMLLVAFTLTAFAQKSDNYPLTALKSATFTLPLDTVTSTAAHYMNSGFIKGHFKTLTVTVSGKEISGTTTGTASLEASMDNVTWYPYFDSKDSVYTFTFTDTPGAGVAQPHRWQLYDWGDNYLRVKVVGGGTTNFTISAGVQARKEGK